MNIIKRLFPKYESKKEIRERLEMEISFLRNTRPGLIIRSERTIEKMRVTAEFERDTPSEIIKRQISRKLADALEPYVDYEITDTNSCKVYCSGCLYVSISKDQTGGFRE